MHSTNQNIYISATVVSSVIFGESLLILCKNAKFDNISHFWKLNYDNTEMTSSFFVYISLFGHEFAKVQTHEKHGKTHIFWLEIMDW